QLYRTQDLAEDICVRAVFLPLSLSCLSSFLSLKATTRKEDHAQHTAHSTAQKAAGPSPDPLCQSPNLPFSLLPALSSPTLTLSLSLLLLLSLALTFLSPASHDSLSCLL
ncbi:hypothetical protein PVAP13_7NG394210, partial [Panicum virgatum]